MSPLARLLTPSLCCALLAGCATFPELDAAISEEAKRAPAPDLVDNGPLLAAAVPGRLDTATREDLQARAAALQAQGSDLQDPVIGAEDRAELSEAHRRLREQASRVAPGS